jgi:NADH dehydrogenase
MRRARAEIVRPVYAGDIARAVEICCRDDAQVIQAVGGKIIEAGGPEGMFRVPLVSGPPQQQGQSEEEETDGNSVFTYREIMELVLRYSGVKRFILSLPYFVGMIQGFFLEKLPENLFTVTRDQASRAHPSHCSLSLSSVSTPNIIATAM